MALFDRVKDIIVRKLQKPETMVTESATLMGDLEADSLDVVELLMEFEEEFEITIPQEDAEKIETVGQIVEYIASRTGEGKKVSE